MEKDKAKTIVEDEFKKVRNTMQGPANLADAGRDIEGILKRLEFAIKKHIDAGK